MATVEHSAPETTISRPPTMFERGSDRLFRSLSYTFSVFALGLVVYIVYKIAVPAVPAIQEKGLSFITGTEWDSARHTYGILPEIWGTLYSSFLALLIGTILGVSVAIFLNEGFLGSFVFEILRMFHVEFHSFWGKLPDRIEGMFNTTIQLLAAIPSVVYGLWGIFVVIPTVRPFCNWLHEAFGFIPIFGTRLAGPGLFPASLVLAIMILPTIAAISRESLAAVPPRIREAAYGLGATRWESILGVILPTAAPGIYGSIILAFGRALGETMALAMLVGNNNEISVSLFSPANTLAALLANNFPEAVTPQDVSLLMYAALVLLAITLIVNVFGTLILQRSQAKFKGAR